MKKFLWIGLSLLLMGFAVSSLKAEETKGTLQIKGSDTMVNLGQAWAEIFMEKYPDASVAVTGGGSGTGIAAILNGTCDIAQSSRDVKEKELEAARKKGFEIVQTQTGIDALAVIVHPANPVSKLTISQLSGIFTKKTEQWDSVGGSGNSILVLSRERNSGTHVYFLEHVVRKGNEKGPEEFAPSVLMMPSSQAIVEEVSQNPSAIGYVGMGYLTDTVKAVMVAKDEKSDYFPPTLEAAKNKQYPVARPLWILTPGQPQGLVKTFVDFMLSAEGQKIVQEMDFVPLR
ncbi:MAG: phosphate ABC transporter substrate-binding protein [Candidatus Omnitrophica bacterium]|nr:phosphate ABC transporter substrate-binding protein [Candidatus Omnitrophota bacterium]